MFLPDRCVKKQDVVGVVPYKVINQKGEITNEIS